MQNSDYRNDNVFLSLDHRWRTQKLFVFGDFDSNDVGEPGPYGSNPVGLYPGLDLISRSKNNTSTYGLHYSDEITEHLRVDVIGRLLSEQQPYISPYGDSFNKDMRGYAEGRLTYAVSKVLDDRRRLSRSHREEMRNTYVTNTNGDDFLLRRDNERHLPRKPFHVRQAFRQRRVCARRIYQTARFPPTPTAIRRGRFFPRGTVRRTESEDLGRLYGRCRRRAFTLRIGTGIRPPGGSDLAFTNNPALQPERTESYDVGVEKRFFGDRLSLDATWFHNRYQRHDRGAGRIAGGASQYSHG